MPTPCAVPKLFTPSAARHAAGLLLLLALAAGCESDPTVSGVIVRVEITPDRDTLTLGEVAAPFTAMAFNVRDEAVPDAEVTWRSDQPFLVAVDSLTGSLTALGTGAAAVTARAGAVSDTAQVFVVGPLSLDLDTILLFPGDTFSIPATVRAGGPSSPVTFGGGDAAVATVDTVTGLITAVGFGVAPFTARVDTFTQRGQVQVLDVPDTTLGNVYLVLSGARSDRFRLVSRAFNLPTLDARTAFQLVAESFDGTQRIVFELIDSLAAARSTAVGELPASALGSGSDPVCFPPVSWSVYDDFVNVRKGRSLSGTVNITTVRPIPGGKAVSGRFRVTLEFLDAPGAAGRFEAFGTLLVPVVPLAACPQSVSAPSRSPGPRILRAAPDGTRRTPPR